MRLVSISVENYRSITKAPKISVGASTILLGPNNEGKSNILRALVAGMNVLTAHRRSPYLKVSSASQAVRASRLRRQVGYEWDRDFPVQLQASRPSGQSLITLEFSLNAEDLVDFQDETESSLNGALPIRVALGPTDYKITIPKRGPGSRILSAKSELIASFVADRLEFEYIPAVRTARSARDIVENMVARELSKLESNEEYSSALARVGELQQPLLDEISATIKDTLVKFLPDVSSVQVGISEETRSRALRRSCEIVVDDGTPTLLDYKGDGVQSLAALGMMRHASETAAGKRHLVIAVEEPESHLHPRAIHQFRGVLLDLAKKHQILITTHNPLFVDRANIHSNILVENTKARPAWNLEEIRQILGVRAADNLRHAELVLVVEGEDDRTALRAILQHFSGRLSTAIESGTIELDSLGGASNLAYKLGSLRDALCLTHCFLDDDLAGRAAFQRAEAEGLITATEVHFSTCAGKPQAELEDLYDADLYAEMISRSFGVSIRHPKFRTNRRWSERMSETFIAQGKQWNAQIMAQAKSKMAALVVTEPGSALLEQRRGPIDALISQLVARLAEISSRRR